MSDICDDSEGVRLLAERGIRFGRAGKQAEDMKRCRTCKLPPMFRTKGHAGKEVLVCPECGYETEPLRSRQALRTMWNGMN